jgi:hypothetical protein
VRQASSPYQNQKFFIRKHLSKRSAFEPQLQKAKTEAEALRSNSGWLPLGNSAILDQKSAE